VPWVEDSENLFTKCEKYRPISGYRRKEKEPIALRCFWLSYNSKPTSTLALTMLLV
jgi:hypothetical protein